MHDASRAGRAAFRQSSADNIAEGRVRKPGANGPVVVPGLWVILHRVGTDRAAPLDSVRADAGGRFRFRYRRSGRDDALYFVSSSFRGVAYFSSPLREAVVRGGDADLLVYDTTTDAKSLHVQGHHVVVSALRDGRREVAEIFELENDGQRTVVPRDASHALWSTSLPAAAEKPQLGMGDLGPGAVEFREGRGDLFAPISPGVRQLVITYRLGTKAFPLSVPVLEPVAVLEVLTEEPRGVVEGANLTETAAADIDGRLFRRFLARNVKANSVVRVDVPAISAGGATASAVLASVMAAAMVGALIAWRWRRRPVASSAVTSPADQLIAELAALDARLARESGTSSNEANARARADLKQRIVTALAREQQHS